jgi:thioredoxin-related protein
MRNLVIFIALILSIQQGYAQLKTVQFEQLDSLQSSDERPVVIFIHTDWCKYCEAMKNTTLKDEKIVSLLNEKYYYIDFDAETKRNIEINGYTFKYKPSGNNTGVHELAEHLGTIDKEISYPTLCFLSEKNDITYQYNQFISASDLSNLLKKLLR